jgi:NAD(P)-dependent dehydrogenase (short-subunit alcohol dehydrogenase family)
MRKLENKIAVVTGASSGIGRSIAFAFAREGATVVVLDVNNSGISDVVDAIVSEGNLGWGEICDVGQAFEVKQVVAKILAKVGDIDILVNNAGIMDDFIPAAELEIQQWHHVLNVNLHGPFYLCHEVLPGMLERGKGVIVNISSIGGVQGGRAGAAYTASKHGVVGLTKNIAFMYANKGIRCNAIAPGGVKTNIVAHMRPNALGYDRAISGSANMSRVADPDEIAAAALFMVSDDASFVNGEVLVADGGWTAY